jgi:hypothetical protein
MLFLALAVLIIMPLALLGPSYAFSYWRANWLMLLIWICFLSVFAIFYFANRRLFLLLEKEDWPVLVRYLEGKILQKGRYSPRLVRLLANSYLVLSDATGVMGLENKIAIAKPALLERNVLIFGTARILGKDISGAVRFFQTHKERARAGSKEWVRWYLGFALLLDRRFEEAADEFIILARLSKDAVISALSSFFLAKNISSILHGRKQELIEVSSNGKERVKKALPKIENWKKELSGLPAEIHTAAISKYLEETGLWLYAVGIEE